MTSHTSSPTPYMLLFRNTGPENYRHMSPEQRQQIITRWNSWFDGLVTAGKAIEGQPLEPESRVIAGSAGRIVDGPFPEAKEAIGGYVTLMVGSMEEATEIAKQHPALAHGLIIEIRKMTPDCHLGVNIRSRASTEVAAR